MEFHRLVRSLRFTTSAFVITSLFVISPGVSNASNIDSLKYVLTNTESTSEKCLISYSIFEHYVAGGNQDSIVQYGVNSIGLFDKNKQDDIKNIVEILSIFTRKGLHNVVKKEISAVSDQMTDVNLKLSFYSWVIQGQVLFNTYNNYDYYWDKATELLPHATDDNALARYYFATGSKNHHIGNYISALQSYKIATTFTDIEDLNTIKGELVNIFILIGDYDRATELLNELIKEARRDNDFTSILFNYFYKMDISLKTYKYEELIDVCHRTLDLHSKHNNFEYMGYTYYMMGEGHISTSNLDSAYYYFKEGIAKSLQNNEIKELKDNYKGLAEYYKAVNDYDKSIIFYQKALDIKTYSDAHINSEINRAMADLCMLQGNCNVAYEILDADLKKKKTKNNNSETDLKLASEIIENAHDYKQKAELKIKEKEKQQSRLRKITIGVIFLLLIGSSILFFLYQNRRKLKTLNNKISVHNSQISARNNELDIITNKQKETIKYLENFAYVAAHDLKAPIRIANSFAALLVRNSGDKLDEKRLSYLKYIDSSVGKLSIMIDDLLSLSKLDVDLPKEEVVDLNEILDCVKTRISELISESQAKIIVEQELPKISGHQSLMMQLFQNIIKNAVNHNNSDREPIIKISSNRKDNDWQIISIEDNSGGIPEYIIPTIFDLFSSTNKNTGNGIGLATCKKIVNHYGGEIWVDVTKDVGSTFNFTLSHLSSK